MAIGLVVFALPKGTFWYGALYGLIGYAIYDLTNYALFAKFSIGIVTADLIWGSVLNGVVLAILLAIQKYM